MAGQPAAETEGRMDQQAGRNPGRSLWYCPYCDPTATRYLVADLLAGTRPPPCQTCGTFLERRRSPDDGPGPTPS